jgi:leucyl aminopeptidase (aminopeptidase T)
MNKKRVARKGAWPSLTAKQSAKLRNAAKTAIERVLRVKKKERVVIVTNPERDVHLISSALYAAALERGADPCVVVQPRRTSLDLASDAVIHALRAEPEVIISISADKLGKDRFGLEKPYRFKGVKGSWPHIFNALMGAGKARSFWSPSVTLDTFCRTVPVDYGLMARQAAKLKRALDCAERVHITSRGGTDVEFGLKGRTAFPDDGAFHKPGSGGNLPAGETYISPVNYDGEGLIVFDGSVSVADGGGAFMPKRPVKVEVKGGRAVRVFGGAGAKRFEQSLILGEKAARKMKGKKGWKAGKVGSHVRNARHLGELGIGLNPAARITGNMLEDEKIMGTCHIAVGANYDNDAEAFIHLDCLIRCPTITVMDAGGRKRILMERGKIR